MKMIKEHTSTSPFYSLFVLSILLLLSPSFAGCSSDSGDDEGGGDNKAGNQYLVAVTAEKTFTAAQIEEQIKSVAPQVDFTNPLLSALLFDVDVAAITYKTTWPNGEAVTASGVVAIPAGTTQYSTLLSVQHGTLDMEEAPSKQLFYYEMAPVLTRSIVVMADYLGYGVSQTADRQHPYLHLASTGTACADMIEAAREYLNGKGITQNGDKVRLMGYSQGGQASVATLLEMERRGKASQVQDVRAGGGPYDLQGTMDYFINGGITQYARTGYIPYIIRGMECGEGLVLNDSNLYAPRVIANGYNRLFSTTALYSWHTLLGNDITQVVNSDFFAPPAYNGNSDILKLVAALKKNAIINQPQPATSVTLYHSEGDDFVPYSNATALHEKWPNSTLVTLETAGHGEAGVEFMLRCMGLWEVYKMMKK